VPQTLMGYIEKHRASLNPEFRAVWEGPQRRQTERGRRCSERLS
jgi:hypothetical protein